MCITVPLAHSRIFFTRNFSPEKLWRPVAIIRFPTSLLIFGFRTRVCVYVWHKKVSQSARRSDVCAFHLLGFHGSVYTMESRFPVGPVTGESESALYSHTHTHARTVSRAREILDRELTMMMMMLMLMGIDCRESSSRSAVSRSSRRSVIIGRDLYHEEIGFSTPAAQQ